MKDMVPIPPEERLRGVTLWDIASDAQWFLAALERAADATNTFDWTFAMDEDETSVIVMSEFAEELLQPALQLRDYASSRGLTREAASVNSIYCWIPTWFDPTSPHPSDDHNDERIYLDIKCAVERVQVLAAHEYSLFDPLTAVLDPELIAKVVTAPRPPLPERLPLYARHPDSPTSTGEAAANVALSAATLLQLSLLPETNGELAAFVWLDFLEFKEAYRLACHNVLVTVNTVVDGEPFLDSVFPVSPASDVSILDKEFSCAFDAIVELQDSLTEFVENLMTDVCSPEDNPHGFAVRFSERWGMIAKGLARLPLSCSSVLELRRRVLREAEELQHFGQLPYHEAVAPRPSMPSIDASAHLSAAEPPSDMDASIELDRDDRDIMRKLIEKRGITEAQLAAAVLKSLGTVKTRLNRLNEAGLVMRPPGTQRKGWSVTPAGNCALAEHKNES